jgi:hypothetical protein
MIVALTTVVLIVCVLYLIVCVLNSDHDIACKQLASPLSWLQLVLPVHAATFRVHSVLAPATQQ